MLEINLAIEELEELEGEIVELVVNGADNSFDGALNGLNTRFQWTRVLFGVLVES